MQHHKYRYAMAEAHLALDHRSGKVTPLWSVIREVQAISAKG
jgi:hypothetical protein